MKYFMIFCLSVLLYSCVAPIHDLTKTQFISPDFDIKQISEGGIALLPVTAIQGHEGFRRLLGDYLNQDFSNALPNGKVLKWQETGELLNKYSKVKAYEDIIQSYKETSIINRDRVKELKEALNVRFAFYCILQNFSDSNENIYSSSSGWRTTRKGSIQAYCLMIDMETGNIMQELNAQALTTDEDFSYFNENYEDYVKTLAASILSQIPGAKMPH